MLGPQEIKGERGLLVGYVTMNTRDRDEVSVVQDAEALLQQAAQGRPPHAPAGLLLGVVRPVREPGPRDQARMQILVPITLVIMFVMLYLGFTRWWIAPVIFFGVLVSASGGFIMLALWGVNLSVAVWVGFLVLFGVVDDDGVVIATYLEGVFKDRAFTVDRRDPRRGHRRGPEAHPSLPDDHRDDGLRPDAHLLGHRPRLGRDAADGDPVGGRHGRQPDHAVHRAVRVLRGGGVEVEAQRKRRSANRGPSPLAVVACPR